MAKTISPAPSEWQELRPPLPEGCRQVAEWLAARVPDDVELYVRPHLNGLRPSIVLLSEKHGMTVLDVIEASIVVERWRRGLNGALVRGSHAEPQRVRLDPNARAEYVRDDVLNVYCPRLGAAAKRDASLAGRLAVYVVFPFDSCAEVHHVCDRHLARGKEILRDAPDEIMPWRQSRAAPLDARMVSDLRNWLVEPDVEAQKRRPIHLNPKQEELAYRRTQSGYRRIKGPPGSGKSQVLATRAAVLAGHELQVLVVTYNITLRHYLRDLIDRASRGGVRSHITITNFHDWLRDLCRNAQLSQQLKEAWAQDIEAADDAQRGLAIGRQALAVLGNDARGYDAVLVDEGQDFELEWWNLLCGVVREDGEHVLVADTGQDLYDRSENWTDVGMTGAGFTGPWATLTGSYRIPRRIHPAIVRLARSLQVERVDLDQGDQQEQFDLTEIRWIETSPENFVDEVARAVATMPTLSDPDPTAYADVFLLVQTHARGLKAVERLEQLRISVGHVFGETSADSRRRKLWFMQDDARVKATTVHSFKGWESRALVVAVDRFTTRTDRMEVYIALTRLKTSDLTSYLTIVNCAPPFSGFRAVLDC
jgi:hypothetical protein